ncbi:MAG: GTPase Era [Candidatus Promineifilaceae bacterium]
MSEQEETYQPSEMAELDLASLAEETLPEGHRSGFVAVIGRPNVGKSTLMNAILKQKVAIVSPRPQTTRTNQLGILTEPDYQIVFVDTPGLISPRHKLDEFMVGVAEEALKDAEVVLWMVDGSEPPGAGDKAIAETLTKLPKRSRLVLAINKADLVAPEDVLPRTEAYRALAPDADWIFFSALDEASVQALLQLLIDALPEGPRYYPADQTTDTFIRDIAAELIREQIFLQMREELPYGTAVQVNEYKLRENGITYIAATIFVERDNHKKIIIGNKGKQLRDIGAGARKEIETLVQGKVYLELWVKVEPQWRRSDQSLKRFGYTQPTK